MAHKANSHQKQQQPKSFPGFRKPKRHTIKPNAIKK